MEDIAPKLLEDIEKTVKQLETMNPALRALKDNIKTYDDANQYAKLLGNILSKAYNSHINGDILPDNKMYYNIAKRILQPTLETLHLKVSNVTNLAQKFINKKNNIGLAPIKPKLNQDRIDGLINRISSEEKFEEVSWMLDEPIKNFAQSIVDSAVKDNVEFQYSVGLRPKVIRKLAGNCCDWCSEVAGVYAYPNVPKDVFRRHRYCRCTVEYEPGDGRRQNVHTKKWKESKSVDKETVKEIKLVNRKDDAKQYREYVDILGQDRMPISLDLFQEMKYNDIEKYEQLIRERNTISKIDAKDWTDSFKKKVKDTYYDFRNEGHELTMHGAERFLKHKQKGKYTKDQVLSILNHDFNFTQLTDNRPMKYYENIQIVYLKNKIEILNIIKRKEGWKP